MNIFYGKSEGREDVSSDAPITAPLNVALSVFHNLDVRSGFMGIVLDERFVLQMTPRQHNRVRIELLDTSIPAFDACEAELQFAESLIKATAEGQDVFQIARTSKHEWEHLDMA